MNIINNLPLVSVVVPCYNHAQYVEECIESVVNQTYKNIQLIVIDDGSKDKSPEILKELQKKYGFILECQKNIGLSKTLNKAIKKYVKGKYYTNIASDDYWCLDKIEKQVSYMEANVEAAMVFGRCTHISSKGLILSSIPDMKIEFLDFETLYMCNIIPALTVMIRSEIIINLGGFNEESYIEDVDLWLRIAYKYKIAYMNDIFGFLRLSDNSASRNVVEMYPAVLNIIDQWKDKIPQSLYNKKIEEYKLSAFNAYSRNYKKKAIRFLPLTLKNYFSIIFLRGLIKLFLYWK
ncbi:putative teichuronic acid biosynthesis glycosyltransferase TuaG [termite gut metagenome]|uniref:Putative teichuronic acid biosynthesis glycosyltransferase TuaG n=1 Tax=termite gut metagenome TaxID=433724 RepID=A0A5J4SS82_9ZZZZ